MKPLGRMKAHSRTKVQGRIKAHNISRSKHFTALVLVLFGMVICLNLIFPLLTLFLKSVDYEPFYQGFAKVFSNAATRSAVKNSFLVSFAASAISIVSAYFYAYIVEYKLRRRARRVFRLLAILPMLVPSITHGIVIVYLFGKRGIFTNLLGVQLPIYGPLGIIMGSFFYAFPIAFLVISQALLNLDGRIFESSLVLGVRPMRRFFEITLPITKYAIFSAFAVCFTMVFTDYGIPLSVGGTYPILPLLFYKNVIGLLDFSRGAIYSLMILVPAVLLYLLDILYFSKMQVSSTHNKIKVRSGRFHPLQKLIFVFLTVLVLVPIGIVLIAPFVTAWPYNTTPTLSHFSQIISVGKLGRLIGNSVFIALGSGILGTLLALGAGYLYVRDPNGLSAAKKVLHGLYMTALAVPGLALGLAFALFFKGTFLYNTILLMIIVNAIHFLGSPYLMAISHFKLLNPNLEAICRTLGGNFFHVLFDIILPNSKRMLLDVFVYFFTNTMVTISAISLLYNSRNLTLALQITAYSDQGAWESAVAVSLVILLLNMTAKIFQSRQLSRGTPTKVPDA